MPSFKVASLEVVASYNQINPPFANRPSPQYISMRLHEDVTQIVDVGAVLAELQQNDYTTETAKAALVAAKNDLVAKLNAHAPGVQLVWSPAVVYRLNSGGSHETVGWLLKEQGGASVPWAFSFVLDGQSIEGFVALSLILAEGAQVPVTEGKAAPRQAQMSKTRVSA